MKEDGQVEALPFTLAAPPSVTNKKFSKRADLYNVIWRKDLRKI